VLAFVARDNRTWQRGAMADTPGTDAGDAASYEDLIRQTRRIYRELEWHGLSARQLRDAWEPVEAAIFVALDTSDDQSGQVVGQTALDAALEVRARWIPDSG
jgi:hypothetical protein